MAPKVSSDISRKLEVFIFGETQHAQKWKYETVFDLIVKYLCQIWNCSRSKSLSFWLKIVKHINNINMFKIRGTTCYDINITCI